MLQGFKISLVVPTLNESGGVRRLMGLVPRSVDEIVVVDGDSQDDTRQVAEELGAKVIVEKRLGYGRAYRTGFERCSGELVATADGDATYPVENLESVVAHLLARGLDFVSCSRFPLAEPGSMALRNRLGNSAMSAAASLLWLHRFKDILSGMWVFRRRILERLALESDDWNFSEEIKIEAYRKLGAGFAEFEIPYHKRIGETKLLAWKVGGQNILHLLAMRLGLAPSPRHYLQ
jgi:glycosyltransferase involved in cell wall biosynthesis